MKKIYLILIFISIIFYPITHSAKEVQIYADSIDYDSNKNIVAKGNVKIIKGDQILTSNIVIVNQKKDTIILPKEFHYKDERNNYYYGTSGEFSSDFVNAKINNVKILLNDGSRIVGSNAYKNDKQDLIEKGVFSPCNSKIKINKFICPIWQVEGEKILHDRDKLFIHTKHAKMRIFNTPVYYFPYMIQPSPLRKKRKSGFLNPTIAFDFLDTKTAQSVSLPYYFAIDVDKELLLTPTLKYGGGVDASQRIAYKYNQLISGGDLSINASNDTNLENDNNEHWLRDASISIGLTQKINEQYHMSFSSALQTSPTYLRRTDQNNILNRKNTLSTSFNLNGHEVFEPNDTIGFRIAGYQVVRNNEDNKKTPTSLPHITYAFGNRSYQGFSVYNNLLFYNLFRDIATDDHSQQQQKFEYSLKANKSIYSLYTKINFRSELYSQFYKIEGKKINNEDFNGTYGRIFPMTGILFETPFINKKYNIHIKPKLFVVVNSSQSNSNKISNEESTDYQYSLLNFDTLSRYTGTDKLENSKRLSYGIEINKDKFNLELGQSYEFDKDRNNYIKNVGLNDYMSDLLGTSKYDGIKNDLLYDFRFNVDQGLMQSHALTYKNENILGLFNVGYSQSRKEVNTILETGTETLSLGFGSNEFLKYNTVSLNASFDLIEDDPTNYTFGYRYIDECFGINMNYERSFYEDRDLKPKDMLTLMFSFKHLGSYKSTNLAVSEVDKQDIRWESADVPDQTFK